MKSLQNNEKGFTLIEIVIVLAIAAGLIIVVLLAVGGANRANLDTKRAAMVGQLASQLEAYENNSGGKAPSAALTGNYISNIVDPGTGVAPVYGSTTATATAPSYYAGTFICGAAGAMTATGATSHNYAISYWSEAAGAAQCKDNK